MGHFRNCFTKFKKWKKQRKLTKEKLLRIANYNNELDMIKETTLSITAKNIMSPSKKCELIVIDGELFDSWEMYKDEHKKMGYIYYEYYIYLLSNGDLYFLKDPLHPSDSDHIIRLRHIAALSHLMPDIDPSKAKSIRQNIDNHAHDDFDL